MSLLVELINGDAKVPIRKTAGSAGYDIYACKEDLIEANSRKLVDTGIRVSIPYGTYGRVAPRSGMACKGIDVAAGVIDSDYRGEVKVLLHNFTNDEYIINKGDRIAQLIIEKIELASVVKVDSLDNTERASGGFGSTGR